MDIEAAKDDSSVDGSKLVVFTDIVYRVENKRLFLTNNNGCRKEGQEILCGASGAFRPGRLTFILGPSGAGKTTLLNILAGRKQKGVTGSIHGGGRRAVLVAQHANLIDSLTADETLRFAASLKLPRASHRQRSFVIQSVSQQLGIHEVLHTRAGRLSGGERKRLTIACELLTDPAITLLDEPTSGLDSVSSLSLVRALQAVARAGRTVACVVHQPSSRLFATADDVIVLHTGRTLYAGPTTDIPDSLARAGLVCPQYYNMADYLLEVATGEHIGNLQQLEAEAKDYAQHMKDIARNEDTRFVTPSQEHDTLLSSNVAVKTDFVANPWQQLRSLLWRGAIGCIRDVHLTQIRVVAHLLVALMLGALYHGAGDSSRVVSNTGCIFFFLMFLFFSNAMPTIHNFPAESTVVLQEHLNKWYSIVIYCITKILVDLPVQIFCATIFFFPAWYLTSQPMELQRMVLAWILCLLVTILAQTFGLVIGAACGVKMGLFMIPAANIPMLVFSEFFIPYQEMPSYLKPFADISYFRYAFDGLLVAVYGFDRPKLACKEIYCMFRSPRQYLDYLGIPQDYVKDISILVIWIILLQISLLCVLLIKVWRACK